MSLALDAVQITSPAPERSAAFWGTMIGQPWTVDTEGASVAGSATQVGLRFERGPIHADDAELLHLHLSESTHDQRGWIDLAIRAGATLLGSGIIPPGKYARMADPVGEGFCVIEDGNHYLDGCGPLGEVTCAGTSRVGRFWSEVLGYPIVWDQNEEIAVQSARGGTKLAWSGVPPTAAQRASGQRLILSADDAHAEGELGRLVMLGATTIRTDEASWALTDPDGAEFVLRRRPPAT